MSFPKGSIDIRNISHNIRPHRLSLGYSQEEVAKKIGVSCITFHRWECGCTKYMKKKNFQKLKELLFDNEELENANE